MPPSLRSQYERELKALEPEPKRMTWGKAMPFIIVAAAFWLVQFFFEWFGITGPALVGAAVGGWISSYLGSIVGSIVGLGAAIGTGLFSSEIFEVVGIAIAEPVALFGWLMVGLMLILGDRRLFEQDIRAVLWFGVALCIAEIPIIGTLPSILGAVVKLLHSQIKRERAAHRAWQANKETLERRQEAQIRALVASQRIETLRVATANDNSAPEVANDNEIPEHSALVA